MSTNDPSKLHRNDQDREVRPGVAADPGKQREDEEARDEQTDHAASLRMAKLAMGSKEQAKAGVRGPGVELPHRARIQASFGTHDVGGIRSHIGGDAAVAAEQMGAKAYATGNAIAFRESPDLHTAAHEAAHVVQQRSGVGEGGALYEQHADAVADRVVRGESAQALLDASTKGSSVEGVVQRKELSGQIFSVNNTERDVMTGLTPKQASAIDDFRAEVTTAMAAWRAKRTTPELEFKTEAGELQQSLSTLRARLAEIDGVATVGDVHPAMTAAAQRIRTATNLRYMQEIRVFNRTLGDYKRLLGFEDIASTHSYQIAPVLDGGVGGGLGGAGVGYSSRTVRIEYSNTELGIAWSQTVGLSGFKLSFGISKDTFSKGPKKPSGAGSGTAPGGEPTPATLEPKDAYLPPSFFGTARYTQVGANAKAGGNLGVGKAKVGGGRSILKISNPDRMEVVQGGGLTWDSGWTVGDLEAEIATTDIDELGKAGADLEAGVEIGGWKATLEDVAKLEGSMEDVEDETSGAFIWTPLHMARVFFGTGESVLNFNGIDTLQMLAKHVKERDKKDGLITTEWVKRRFKIEIVGFYSHQWSQHDPEIQRLEAKEASGRATQKDLRRKEELVLLKQAENEALAFDRAQSAKQGIDLFLGMEGVSIARKAIDDQVHYEAPLEGTPFEDRDEDRRAEVRVSGLLYDPQAPKTKKKK